MTAITRAAGRHRRSKLVLPAAPDDKEKLSYASRSLPYLTAALTISLVFVVISQVLFEERDPAIAAPFMLYTGIYAAYQIVSLPVNFTGRNFDLAAHLRRVSAWRPSRYPSVDIFLPICGEPVPVLRNTWAGVAELLHAYPGSAHAFVLDDGPGDPELRETVEALGFTYLRRPNPGHHKKSGNLANALRSTCGRACRDLRRGLPAPLRFPGGDASLYGGPFDRARPDTAVLPGQPGPDLGGARRGRFTLEVFYRAVQVSRDRFGSALCVGSNAVYRRSALAAAGGFTEIPYAEDSHTGLDLRYAGYRLGVPADRARRGGVPVQPSTPSCASSTDGAAGPPR